MIWAAFKEFFYWKHDLSAYLGSPLIFEYRSSHCLVFQDYDDEYSDVAWADLISEFPSVKKVEEKQKLVISDTDFVKLKLTYF